MRRRRILRGSMETAGRNFTTADEKPCFDPRSRPMLRIKNRGRPPLLHSSRASLADRTTVSSRNRVRCRLSLCTRVQKCQILLGFRTSFAIRICCRVDGIEGDGFAMSMPDILPAAQNIYT